MPNDTVVTLLFDAVYALHPDTVQSAIGDILRTLGIEDPLTPRERRDRRVSIERVRRQAVREVDEEERRARTR